MVFVMFFDQGYLLADDPLSPQDNSMITIDFSLKFHEDNVDKC